ncbi:MAG: sterol desaturase family protein [Bacteroidetes bacterium]|nr:sterol desaturase family protein [Bacteroidota bacterium]
MSKLFVSNKDETARMFKSDFLEAFSKIHWTVPLFIYVPVIGYLFYLTIVDKIPALEIFGLIAAGLFIWTITEYLLHRFIFHFHTTSNFGKRITFMFHGVHHDYPNDTKRLVMPPSVSIPLATGFFFLFKVLLGDIFLAPFFIGFIAGYLFYDISHYAIHHFNMHSKFWLVIKNHHMRHHYQRPELGFGVSSPLWDLILKTGYDAKKKD